MGLVGFFDDSRWGAACFSRCQGVCYCPFASLEIGDLECAFDPVAVRQLCRKQGLCIERMSDLAMILSMQGISGILIPFSDHAFRSHRPGSR